MQPYVLRVGAGRCTSCTNKRAGAVFLLHLSMGGTLYIVSVVGGGYFMAWIYADGLFCVMGLLFKIGTGWFVVFGS